MEKGVQAILFHAWSEASAKRLGQALTAGKYRGVIHMGVAPFTGPSQGDLAKLANNMSVLKDSFKGRLSVCIFLSFHNEKNLTPTDIASRASQIKNRLAAVTGSAAKVSICPMLEDQWGGATTTLDAMLAAAATPFVLNNQLSGVRLRRSSNENSRVPSILTVAVGRGKTAEIRVSVEYESHGMAPRSGARYYSNDGNFVCMEAEPAGQKTPLAYLEGKDSASNPTGTPNGNNDKFTLKEYLLNRAVSAAPVNLLWRPAYNLYPVQSVGPAKVGERLKAKYNMSVPSSGRTDTPTGMFNEVEAACLARFLS